MHYVVIMRYGNYSNNALCSYIILQYRNLIHVIITCYITGPGAHDTIMYTQFSNRQKRQHRKHYVLDETIDRSIRIPLHYRARSRAYCI